MIISHRHKFIFLKTNKTAGTSVEIALSRVCGPEDVITPVSPEDELTRNECGGRGPQHYVAPFWQYRWKDATRLVAEGRKKYRFRNHLQARQVRARIGEAVWDSYFKFCIERNPWDRVISLYYWHYPSEPRPAVSEFVHSEEPLDLKRAGFELYTIDGTLAVNKVCRFERLADELEDIRTKLGIAETLELPRAKSRFRSDKRSYREILTDTDRRKIAEVFAPEIEMMGYEF